MQSCCKQDSHLKEETYVGISLDYNFIAGINCTAAWNSLEEWA